MDRSTFAPALTVLFCAALVSGVFAQAQSAAPTTLSSATRTKWVAPVKGIATIQVIKGDTKRVKNELVTSFKIKNVSNGAIALLRIDEYWYDASQQPKLVTADTQRYMKPLNPGEIIEMTTRSPAKPGAARSQVAFTHANGKIDPKLVKKFE